jgi:hypothetical protein
VNCGPCECGLVYFGETGRNLSVRLKEHKTNCEKAEQDKNDDIARMSSFLREV